MKKRIPAIAMTACALVLSACAVGGRSDPATLFDLGPLKTQQGASPLPALPPISIAAVQVPVWLDSSMMFYRLNYANTQQPRPYSQARWTMTPAQLLTQSLKARIAQAGGVALAAADGAVDVPILRIEADDFSQHFASPSESTGQVALRASLYRGRTLLAQRSFIRQAPSGSADATGGAAALAAASDAAISDIILWLHGLPLK
ncbi:ABC-type transport auxiliary lipoprotein family protein [Noviherbaspirillum sp. ST9]|uniref:ABC-type transport auxiliary lipoprotein family protein n=1 Tax=Noviherbaspirillum sp. ST9 TaxID=3401606 RepID=UPI003B58A334